MTPTEKAAQLATLAAVRAAFNTVVLPGINAAGADLQARLTANGSPELLPAVAAFNAVAVAMNAVGAPFRKAVADTEAMEMFVPAPPPPAPAPPAPVPTTLNLPPVLSLSVGVPQPLAAYATSGKPLTWSASPGPAVISPDGVLTLQTPGSYDVTITVDDGA